MVEGALRLNPEKVLDSVWLDCARELGLQVSGGASPRCSYDGQKLLALPLAELESPFALPALLLQQLCLALLLGPDALDQADFGCPQEEPARLLFERASMELSRELCLRQGLRNLADYACGDRSGSHSTLAPLPLPEATRPELDAEAQSELEQELQLRVRAALYRESLPPFRGALSRALRLSSQLCRLLQRELRAASELEGLHRLIHPEERSRHPLGFPKLAQGSDSAPLTSLGPEGARTGALRCGDCSWSHRLSKNGRLRCRQADDQLTQVDAPACERFEQNLDCQACGACCREAYGLVIAGAREVAVKLHPELFVRHQAAFDLPRPLGLCPALEGGRRLVGTADLLLPSGELRRSLPLYAPSEQPFACRIYEARPKTCRDFQQGSLHCLEARRSLGLSY